MTTYCWSKFVHWVSSKFRIEHESIESSEKKNCWKIIIQFRSIKFPWLRYIFRWEWITKVMHLCVRFFLLFPTADYSNASAINCLPFWGVMTEKNYGRNLHANPIFFSSFRLLFYVTVQQYVSIHCHQTTEYLMHCMCEHKWQVFNNNNKVQ